MTPSPLAVYAVSDYFTGDFDIRYAMTKVTPPARSYQMTVPPGVYEVVARLDSDPLSSAGYLTCTSSSCAPVMTRAGYVECRSLDCQPVLAQVDVSPGQSVTHIDVGGWGSLHALDQLWRLDEFGVPGPIKYIGPPSPGTTPTPEPQLPTRQLPPASSESLPSVFSLPNVQVHLPAGWRAVPNPAQAVDQSGMRDFANQAARDSLSLDGDGVWLTVGADIYGCPPLKTHGGTARATFDTPHGLAYFYLEDPHSPVGGQPFSGYAFFGTRITAGPTCFVFRFTAPTNQARETALPTFIEIVGQAQ